MTAKLQALLDVARREKLKPADLRKIAADHRKVAKHAFAFVEAISKCLELEPQCEQWWQWQRLEAGHPEYPTFHVMVEKYSALAKASDDVADLFKRAADQLAKEQKKRKP